MKTTPRWMTAALRQSALEQPVLPWQHGYRTADSSAPVADTRTLRKTA